MSNDYSSVSLLSDPFVLARARAKARDLARRLNLAGDHVDDLTQDFLLVLCRKVRRFDPDRSPLGAFVAMVLRQAQQESFRRLVAERKQASLTFSLEIGNADANEEALTLVETIDADACLAAMDRLGMSRTEAMELRLDVEKTLGELPSSLRRTAEELMDEPRGLAGRRGCARSTLRRSVAALRDAFAANGLDVFSASPRNVSGNAPVSGKAEALAPVRRQSPAAAVASGPGSRANTRTAREITRPRAPSEASGPGPTFMGTTWSDRAMRETVCTTA